jgi:hypothetical protein
MDKEVVVVSIEDYSWDVLLKNGMYAFPKGTRKVGDYFAFYKKAPVSAITHYAKVLSFKEGDKNEVGIGYWVKCFPDADPPYVIVNFEKVKKLKNPIKKNVSGRGKGHVQGRIYTTLTKLLKAKTISELL